MVKSDIAAFVGGALGAMPSEFLMLVVQNPTDNFPGIQDADAGVRALCICGS
jgi:hypothetical protein